MMQRIRVILAAHGEAETTGLVDQFKVGWHTLGHAAEFMRLSTPLRIAVSSAAALRKRFSGSKGSLHNANTRAQCEALQADLEDDPHTTYQVQPAFASAPPYLQELLVVPEQFDRQIIVNMIPSDSRLSCGLTCHALVQHPPCEQARTSVTARMWDSPELIKIHCAHITSHFPQIPAADTACLVLVLHGTLIRDRNGKKPEFHTGEEEKKRYGDALRAALMQWPQSPWQRVEIAYLNHGVGGQWSSPTLPELLTDLNSQGIEHVVAYAAEHLVDGSETVQLPDILATESGGASQCLPCLNSAPAFIDFLAQRVRAAVAEETMTLCCDRCPLRHSAT